MHTPSSKEERKSTHNRATGKALESLLVGTRSIVAVHETNSTLTAGASITELVSKVGEGYQRWEY